MLCKGRSAARITMVLWRNARRVWIQGLSTCCCLLLLLLLLLLLHPTLSHRAALTAVHANKAASLPAVRSS